MCSVCHDLRRQGRGRGATPPCSRGTAPRAQDGAPGSSGDFEDVFGFGDLGHGARGQLGGDCIEGRGAGGIGSGESYGHAGVAALADLGKEFNGAEEGDVELLRGALGAAAGEDVDFVMAVGAGEVRHVLHDTEDFDIDLMEHFEGLARILERDVGGRGDDYCAGEGDGLHQRDDDVAGAGGEIDEEDVELAPFNLLEELADDLVKHGATHDEGLVAGRDEADGDDLDAVRDVGLDLIVGQDGGLAGGAEHEGDIGSVDVGVNEAGAMAEFGEGDGEVDGEGGFADAAFAGSDGNDGFDAGERCGGRRSRVVGHEFRVPENREQGTGCSR